MQILTRNYRKATGEIDVIAQDGRTIVFVEVKQRSTVRYGQPAEAVNRAKMQHIVRTAMLYLAEAEFVTGHVLNVDGGYVI